MDEKQILEVLSFFGSTLKQAIPDDIMLGITDREKFIFYEPSKLLHFNIKNGDPIPLEDISLQTALKGKSCSTRVPEAVFGSEFMSYATPITFNGKVIGVIGMAYTIKHEIAFEATLKQYKECLNEIKQKNDSIYTSFNKLTETCLQITEKSEETLKSSKQMDTIINVMGNIARQTNLIGLNAGIESARVGEQGKGFAIVAQEIRKLATESQRASKEIESSLSTIKDGINTNVHGLHDINDATQQQTQTIQEFMRIITNMQTISEELNGLMGKILKI